MSLKSIVTVALFTVICLAGPAAAQNLVVNPDFTSGLDLPWETSGLGLSGTWSHDPANGNLAAGSASCTDNESCVIQQCIDVSSLSHPASLELAGFVSHAGQVSSVARYATVFTNITCSGFGQTIENVQTFFPPASWTELSSTFATNADTQAILIQFGMSPSFGEGPIATRLDDVRLVSNQVVFNEDFESGDLLDWSSAVGD